MSLPSLRLDEFPERGFGVWFALCAPILAWTVHLIGLTALAEYSYEVPGATWWMHGLTIVTGIVTLVAMAMSFVMVRRAPTDESDPGALGRTRFLGEMGLLIGAINLALILLEEVYLNVLHGYPHG